SRGELAEALVVVLGVVPVLRVGLRVPAGHDPPGTAMVHPGGLHGELAVVALLLLGQDALAVEERDAVVARVVEGSARLDVVDDLLGLARDGGRGTGRYAARSRLSAGLRAAGRRG